MKTRFLLIVDNAFCEAQTEREAWLTLLGYAAMKAHDEKPTSMDGLIKWEKIADGQIQERQ